MIRILATILLISTLASCNKKMIQLAELKPVSASVERQNDHYVFDNDTVRITYSFWAHHGMFGFTIENKLSVPIYVDWKKSNLVYNNTPNVYWTDETVVKSISTTSGIGYRLTSNMSLGSATTVGESVIRPKERITFLPPKAVIERNEYAIENGLYYLMNLNASGESVPNDANPKKLTSLYRQNFTERESPLELTNFLTISLKENFDQEWFIKNTFYLAEISEMELSHFRGKCKGRDENDLLICPRKLKSETKYFLYVPQGYDFLKRKKRKMTKYENPFN